VPYSWYLARKSERAKRLVLDVGPSVPLVSVIPESTGIKLSVAYEKDGAAPIPVQSLYLTFVRIGNLGREPIRAEDIAPNDPLILIVEDSPVLDIATVETVRSVSEFQLEKVVITSDKRTQTGLSFAFLDFQDGALIRVLTETATPTISLTGTVIGLPGGADRKNYFESAQSSGCWIMLVFPLMFLFPMLILPRLSEWFHWHLGVGATTLIGTAIAVVIFYFSTNIYVHRSHRQKYMGEWPDKLSLPYWFSDSWGSEQRKRLDS